METKAAARERRTPRSETGKAPAGPRRRRRRGLADSIGDVLRGGGYEVEQVGDGNAALASVARTRPAVVLLDWRLPSEPAGSSLVRKLRDACGHVPVVVLSADPQSLAEAREAHVEDYLPSPSTCATVSARRRTLRLSQAPGRRAHVARADQEVVGVERREGEDADAGGGQRRGQRREHAGDGEVDGAGDAKGGEVALGAHAVGDGGVAQTIDHSSSVRVIDNSGPGADASATAHAGSGASAAGAPPRSARRARAASHEVAQRADQPLDVFLVVEQVRRARSVPSSCTR